MLRLSNTLCAALVHCASCPFCGFVFPQLLELCSVSKRWAYCGFIQRNNTIFCFVLILLKILNRIVSPKCWQLTLCWSFWRMIHFSKTSFFTGNRGFKVWQEWLFPHLLFFIHVLWVKFTVLTPTGFVSSATYPQCFQILYGLWSSRRHITDPILSLQGAPTFLTSNISFSWLWSPVMSLILHSCSKACSWPAFHTKVNGLAISHVIPVGIIS